MIPRPLPVHPSDSQSGSGRGAPSLTPPPPSPGPSPLLPTLRHLGLQPCQDLQGALRRAAALRRGARRGAWPRRGAELPPPPPPIAEPVGVAADHVTLRRVRLVAAQCRKCLQGWPRLQGLVSQWWEQPAQWALAPPPGRPSLSHWLRRWSRAARALAPPPRREGPEEEGEEPQQPKGRGRR
ncbi:HAUS augmin-like complex subunit 5 [Phaenicophaeus curvirostris]|uniref:HAUS augmin-like complex subunit 5 n=1 Tax=Phaenicophaeus curvirostris TaxID=33595 RepID=UPI0037F0BEC6